jgi:hypothetical protein
MKIQGQAMTSGQIKGGGKSSVALGMSQTPRAKAATHPRHIGTDARGNGWVGEGVNLGQT